MEALHQAVLRLGVWKECVGESIMLATLLADMVNCRNEHLVGASEAALSNVYVKTLPDMTASVRPPLLAVHVSDLPIVHAEVYGLTSASLRLMWQLFRRSCSSFKPSGHLKPSEGKAHHNSRTTHALAPTSKTTEAGLSTPTNSFDSSQLLHCLVSFSPRHSSLGVLREAILSGYP